MRKLSYGFAVGSFISVQRTKIAVSSSPQIPLINGGEYLKYWFETTTQSHQSEQQKVSKSDSG